MGSRPIVFLSDYGLVDEFVGIVHRVVAGISPATRVIDLTHGIPPHSVRAGALTLWRSAPWLRDAVVLAVVDPGVGTSRRPVALDVHDTRTVLVGPDNGLLLPAAHALGSITTAVQLHPVPDPPARDRPAGGNVASRGATFDGRDLFGPVAARIAGGLLELTQAGVPIAPDTLVGEPVAPPVPEAGGLLCEVLWVDRFGNAQLNAGPGELPPSIPSFQVDTATMVLPARLVRAYRDLGPGEVGLVIDSYGLLSLASNGSSAAGVLAIREGDAVRIRRA